MASSVVEYVSVKVNEDGVSDCCKKKGGPGCATPLEAMSGPKEAILCTTCIYSGTGRPKSDYLVTVDVDQTHLRIRKLPHVGDELHHSDSTNVGGSDFDLEDEDGESGEEQEKVDDEGVQDGKLQSHPSTSSQPKRKRSEEDEDDAIVEEEDDDDEGVQRCAVPSIYVCSAQEKKKRKEWRV